MKNLLVKEETLVVLTRVGFLGGFFAFTLTSTMGRLALPPFHPLSLSLFLPLLLLGRRKLSCGRKLLRPRLRPQRRLRPRFSAPDRGQQAQPPARHTTQLPSTWPLGSAPRRPTRHMRRWQLLPVLARQRDLCLAADPHHPQGTDRQS